MRWCLDTARVCSLATSIAFTTSQCAVYMLRSPSLSCTGNGKLRQVVVWMVVVSWCSCLPHLPSAPFHVDLHVRTQAAKSLRDAEARQVRKEVRRVVASNTTT